MKNILIVFALLVVVVVILNEVEGNSKITVSKELNTFGEISMDGAYREDLEKHDEKTIILQKLTYEKTMPVHIASANFIQIELEGFKASYPQCYAEQKSLVTDLMYSSSHEMYFLIAESMADKFTLDELEISNAYYEEVRELVSGPYYEMLKYNDGQVLGILNAMFISHYLDEKNACLDDVKRIAVEVDEPRIVEIEKEEIATRLYESGRLDSLESLNSQIAKRNEVIKLMPVLVRGKNYSEEKQGFFQNLFAKHPDSFNPEFDDEAIRIDIIATINKDKSDCAGNLVEDYLTAIKIVNSKIVEPMNTSYMASVATEAHIDFMKSYDKWDDLDRIARVAMANPDLPEEYLVKLNSLSDKISDKTQAAVDFAQQCMVDAEEVEEAPKVVLENE